jgi:hypothetical protein
LSLFELFRSEPPLQFGDPRLQRRHLGRVALLLRQQQRDQLGVRKLPERGAVHATHELTTQTRVNHNLRRYHRPPILANGGPVAYLTSYIFC